MKNFFSALLLTLVLLVSFTACNRPDKKLPSKDGKWNYSAVSTVGGLSSTLTGTMTFTKEGKCTVASGGASSTVNWSYDKSGKKITFDDDVYEVKEAKAKSEKWQYTESGLTLDVTLTR